MADLPYKNTQEPKLIQRNVEWLAQRFAGIARRPVQRVIGATGQPVFTGTWGALGTGRPPRFYKRDGRVYLAGVLAGGVSSTAAFVLPADCLPDTTDGVSLAFPAATGNGGGTYGTLVITATGGVTPIGAGVSTACFLDGIDFLAAA